jgi:hypothetical protein
VPCADRTGARRRPLERGASAAGPKRSDRLEGDVADDVRFVAGPPADEQRGGDGRRQRNDGANPQGVMQAVDVGLRRALVEGGAGGDECPQRGDADRDIADLPVRLEETEAAADDLPHRRKYLLLVTGFMRRLFQLHLDLVDEVERELDGPAT